MCIRDRVNTGENAYKLEKPLDNKFVAKDTIGPMTKKPTGKLINKTNKGTKNPCNIYGMTFLPSSCTVSYTHIDRKL